MKKWDGVECEGKVSISGPEFGRENVSVTRREEATFQGLGSVEPWDEKGFSPSFFFFSLFSPGFQNLSTLRLATPLLLNHHLFPVSLCNQHTKLCWSNSLAQFISFVCPRLKTHFKTKGIRSC